MASIITEGINVGAFELIRDRIGLILSEELPNQAILKSDTDLNIQKIWVERFVPFSHTECPAINVSLSDGNYGNKTRLNQHGKYQFFIDIIDKGKTTDENLGGQLASVKVQKITNVCRGILGHYSYNTLAFAPPFIEHTKVESIKVGNPGNDKESVNMVMARITFTVDAPENFKPFIPSNIEGYVTKAILGLTDKGYLYGGDAYVPPVTPICAPVTITRDSDFYQFVDSGGTFNFDTNCDPAIIEVNSLIFGPAESGETTNIIVKDLDNNIVPISISDGSIIVPSSNKVYYNREWWTDTQSIQDYDVSWWILNGINEYNQSIPNGSIIQEIDYTDLTKRDVLVHPNENGNNVRFSGVNGGYVDYNGDGLTYDKYGYLSDFNTEFPEYRLGMYLIIDHLSGLMYPCNVISDDSINFNTNLLNVVNSIEAGFSDWIPLSRKVSKQLWLHKVPLHLHNSYRTPFAHTSTQYWTCSNYNQDKTNRGEYNHAYSNLFGTPKTNTPGKQWQFRIYKNGYIGEY